MSQQLNWDAFISHASEDKEAFVRPLATALQEFGAKIWYDEFTLKLGDSLSESINHGLSNSKFGIVILSPSFVAKKWTRLELQGLTTREVGFNSTILPVWHHIDYATVSKFSPILADRLAVSTATLSATQIARQILAVINPTIYAGLSDSEMKSITAREAFLNLQEELDTVREHLNEFLCPDCGANVVEALSVPLDMSEKHWGLRRVFECGRMELDGTPERRCGSA